MHKLLRSLYLGAIQPLVVATLAIPLTHAKAETSRSQPAANESAVIISWTYQSFPLKIELYTAREEKQKFISETKVVNSLNESAAKKPLNGLMKARWNSPTSAVLVIRNTSAKDLYFFAVPHELNPHHASAGHYFECLCNGRVFKVPPKKIWYRIVRLNLNESFQGLKRFTINHQIIGITEKEALTTYKDRLYGSS